MTYESYGELDAADLASPSWAHREPGWCRDCREECDEDESDGMSCACCVQERRDAEDEARQAAR